jgi:hypothetical protein
MRFLCPHLLRDEWCHRRGGETAPEWRLFSDHLRDRLQGTRELLLRDDERRENGAGSFA